MMDAIEKEIRDNYQRLGTVLAEPAAFGAPTWYANSQYGYTLSDHDTRAEAEAAAIAYYRERMNLIRQ